MIPSALRAAILLVAGTGLVHAQLYDTPTAAPPKSASTPSSTPASTTAPTVAPHSSAPAGSVNDAALGREVDLLCRYKKYDEALKKLNPVLLVNPRDQSALSLRGYVYSKQGKWELARNDFQTILQLSPKDIVAKFDLAELLFLQKNYADARAGFALLGQDRDIGDLARYKVFLCDLYGNEPAKAQAELDAFNVTASGPSYYFGNAAWELFNKNPEGARPWLDTAGRIFYPGKLETYGRTLLDLGYLPLPPPPGK